MFIATAILLLSLTLSIISALDENSSPLSPSNSLELSISDITLPVCSVDFIKHKTSGEEYIFSETIYIDKTGKFRILGAANDLNSIITDIQYNRTSPDYFHIWELAVADDGSFNELDEGWYSQDWETDFIEGWHNACCRATDQVNNVGSGTCIDFCIDTSNPEEVKNLMHSNPSQCVSNYVNEAPQFEWDAAEDNGCAGVDFYEVELYLSNGNLIGTFEVSETSFTVPSPLNGEDYYIKVRTVDMAGNEGPWSGKSGDVYYDTEEPAVEITNENAGEWLKGDLEITEIDADANLYKCFYQVKNNDEVTVQWTETPCNEPFTIDTKEVCPEDGKNNCLVYKKAQDKACNDNTRWKEFDIDNHAPITTKIISGPKYTGFEWLDWVIDWFITDKTEITFTCDDKDGSGCDKTFYRVKFNEGEWSVWFVFNETPLTFEEDGVYFVEYSSQDLIGNIENDNKEIDKVDTLPPVSIKTEEPVYEDSEENIWVGPLTEFTIVAEDEEVGVDKIIYQIDENEEVEYESQFTLENECQNENPLHSIDYYSIDYLLNQEEPKTQAVMLDCVAPSIRILNPNEDEREIERCAQSIVAIVEDNGAGVKKVWAELWNETSKIREVEMMLSVYNTYEALMDKQLPAGEYTLKLMAEDNVGNVYVENIDETLLNSVYVEFISPAICSIDSEEGGQCDFTFHICMRGGDSIKFWLDKLGQIVTPAMMNATISKEDNSTFVGLLDEGIDAGLLNLGNGVINGRTNFNLHLTVPSDVASQIGAGAHKLDYLIKSFVQ